MFLQRGEIFLREFGALGRTLRRLAGHFPGFLGGFEPELGGMGEAFFGLGNAPGFGGLESGEADGFGGSGWIGLDFHDSKICPGIFIPASIQLLHSAAGAAGKSGRWVRQRLATGGGSCRVVTILPPDCHLVGAEFPGCQSWGGCAGTWVSALKFKSSRATWVVRTRAGAVARPLRLFAMP